MSDDYTDRLFEEIVQHLHHDDGFRVLPPKGPFRRVIVTLGIALAVVAVLLALVVAPSSQPSNPTPVTPTAANTSY